MVVELVVVVINCGGDVWLASIGSGGGGGVKAGLYIAVLCYCYVPCTVLGVWGFGWGEGEGGCAKWRDSGATHPNGD